MPLAIILIMEADDLVEVVDVEVDFNDYKF
jgi:hypothetical protein